LSMKKKNSISLTHKAGLLILPSVNITKGLQGVLNSHSRQVGTFASAHAGYSP
jgi:hypothetical protein